MAFAQPKPILRILDEDEAREFYIDFLGFTVDWEHRFEDGTPLYMQVSRDGCVLHLSGHFGEARPGAALRIETTELDSFNEELLAKPYKHARPCVNDTQWGREMRITDPFGNHLIFTDSA
jgi:uncharacterized glyoxalase superfamily protein PhnB